MQTSPPANGEYMIAAYVITVVIVVGYAIALFARARKALRKGE